MFGVVETGHALSLQLFGMPCLYDHSVRPVSTTLSDVRSSFSAFHILTAPATVFATTALNRATDPLSSGCTLFVSRITAIL